MGFGCALIRGEPYLVADQLADLARASVGNGENLDQLGILNTGSLGSLESGLEVDAPVGAQPDEGLGGNDGTAKDKSPFLSADVFVVELGGQVVPQEDGPNDGKRPDVGV